LSADFSIKHFDDDIANKQIRLKDVSTNITDLKPGLQRDYSSSDRRDAIKGKSVV